MSDPQETGSERSECTIMDCSGEAEYGYWMPDLGQFSRVQNPEHDLLDHGDLAPYVCESCRDRMAASPRWESGRFVDPREKLMADGGQHRPPCEAVEHMSPTANYGNLERRVCPNCRLYFDTGEKSAVVFCSRACRERHQQGRLIADGGTDSTDIERAVDNLFAIVEGDQEVSKKAYEEAMEAGLDDFQKSVAARYAGEGRVEVDSQRIPTLADKIAANAKIPWTFVLDGVEFVVKTKMGSGSSVADSEWWWSEEGYKFTFYKRSDGGSEVSIQEVDRDV